MGGLSGIAKSSTMMAASSTGPNHRRQFIYCTTLSGLQVGTYKVIALEGTAPKRATIQIWDSMEQA
jgi:hypothetical protein